MATFTASNKGNGSWTVLTPPGLGLADVPHTWWAEYANTSGIGNLADPWYIIRAVVWIDWRLVLLFHYTM